MERGVRRWLVDISKWNPSRDEFSFIVSLFPPNEHSCVTRFVKFEDRKRAIVSRLLQYALVNEALGVPFNEITIRRTVEGKPYLSTLGYVFTLGGGAIVRKIKKQECVARSSMEAEYIALNTAAKDAVDLRKFLSDLLMESVAENLEFPNFNFNVSHHGDYVGIASEPLCLVGLDIVSHVIPMQETSLEYIGNFSPYLSRLEWCSIISAGTGNQILRDFYRYWCLKEAYVKAIGAGVSFRLDRLEFHHTDWSDISVHIDGEESTEWKFCLFELGGNRHWVSVAKGHPRMATKNYKQTLKRTEFGDDEYCLVEANMMLLKLVTSSC